MSETNNADKPATELTKREYAAIEFARAFIIKDDFTDRLSRNGNNPTEIQSIIAEQSLQIADKILSKK